MFKKYKTLTYKRVIIAVNSLLMVIVSSLNAYATGYGAIGSTIFLTSLSIVVNTYDGISFSIYIYIHIYIIIYIIFLVYFVLFCYIIIILYFIIYFYYI